MSIAGGAIGLIGGGLLTKNDERALDAFVVVGFCWFGSKTSPDRGSVVFLWLLLAIWRWRRTPGRVWGGFHTMPSFLTSNFLL